MVFDPVTSEQRQQFFRNGYAAHLPGYTGHCPTLKFRVGKRFGANTQEIMKELLENKILKNGPYRPNSGKDTIYPLDSERNSRRQHKNDTNSQPYTAPFILGYTGYIPGFNTKYGLPFMRAVEEGGKEWRATQNKLRERRETMRAQTKRTKPMNLLLCARNGKVDAEIDHGHEQITSYYDNQVSPERPPIVGYTGHIPGARSEVALSRRYAQAAREGLGLLRHERLSRYRRMREAEAVQRVLDSTGVEDTDHASP